MYEGRPFRFWRACKNAPEWYFSGEGVSEDSPYVSLWDEMIGTARQIGWETLLKHVPVEQLRDLFPWYEWGGHPDGLHISRDWAVGFHRSRLNGKPVYYVQQSGIEYVFSLHGRAP